MQDLANNPHAKVVCKIIVKSAWEVDWNPAEPGYNPAALRFQKTRLKKSLLRGVTAWRNT
jgi:hypothetical protein